MGNMATTNKTAKSRRISCRSKGRPSVRDTLRAALKRLGYTSRSFKRAFEAYLFDRSKKTLAQMADELGIPRPSFSAEHRRFMADQATEPS